MGSETERDFYLVWNPQGGNPWVRHLSLDDAVRESRRLATAAPGTDFYVLHAVSVSRVKDPVETIGLDDGLPF